MKWLLVLLLLPLAAVRRVSAGVRYTPHDPVRVVVGRVWDFGNDTEMYSYYSRHFCHAADNNETKGVVVESTAAMSTTSPTEDAAVLLSHRQQRLNESSMAGVDRRRRETSSSSYDISFLDTVDRRMLCETALQATDLGSLADAIRNNYHFFLLVESLYGQVYVGDVLPDEQFIIFASGSKTFLFPHLHFHLCYDGDQIVAAKMTTDPSRRVDITDVGNELVVQFSYSVDWSPEKSSCADHTSRYNESRFVRPLQSAIHWLSINNSVAILVILTGLLTSIRLGVLKKDFSRPLKEEKSGWKLIHGDVFRFPGNLRLFCAAVGSGTHLLFLTVCHLSLAWSGILATTRRESILAGFVVLYCLTSFVGGFTAVRLYRQMNGEDWIRCIFLTACVFPAPVACLCMLVHSIVIIHGSTSPLPFTTIGTFLSLFVLVSLPLTAVGGYMAKEFASDYFGAPTLATKEAREIPMVVSCYRGRAAQMCFAGFVPFSVIYMELHFIFASMWGHEYYALFGFLFLTFVLTVIVTSLTTITLLYIQLVREDHRWWWATYINGGMTGFFIFIYSISFYVHSSGMTGMLQGTAYFGYTAAASFAYFLMLGSAAFHFSLIFVKYIYSRIKID